MIAPVQFFYSETKHLISSDDNSTVRVIECMLVLFHVNMTVFPFDAL